VHQNVEVNENPISQVEVFCV